MGASQMKKKDKMTKPLNFTCKEKLSHLLSLKKGDELQTIRLVKYGKEVSNWEYGKKDKVKLSGIPKPPKYKVGDVVDMVWDLENKEEWFCKRHGNPIMTKFSNLDKDFKIDYMYAKNFRFGKECGCTPPVIYHEMQREMFDYIFFNKNLGKIKITEVFKIEMDKFSIKRLDKRLYSVTQLAQRDGLKDWPELKNYIDKKYDLSTPKEFYVYRGEVL